MLTTELVGDLVHLEFGILSELAPQSVASGLEFRGDLGDGLLGLPHADELHPASLPVDEDVVPPEADRLLMDRADYLPIRSHDGIEATRSNVDAKCSRDHVILRSALRGASRGRATFAPHPDPYQT
jgi:hypothetical protein